MTRLLLLLVVAAAMATPLQCAFAQGRVFTSDKLPPASIELKGEPPATTTPWQLPKPGDPLYDAGKEAEIKNNKQSHLVHVFERGVFKGYATLTSGPSPERRPAKQMYSAFTPNPKLPPDAVELASSEHADKSDYFQMRPKTRPANVPSDHILVRVFQGKKFIGWGYLPKDGVAALHKPK